MSDENDDTTGGEGIKNLRKEFEALKKQLAERDQELDGYRAEKRQRTVQEVLKAKGLPEKVASLYQSDDASEEAVGKWIEEFGDVFGVKQEQKADDSQNREVQRVQEVFSAPETSIDRVPGGGKLVGDPNELLAQMKALSYDQLVEAGLLPNVKGSLYDTHGR